MTPEFWGDPSGERFLYAVNPQVFGEVSFTRKALSTLIACIWFLSGVKTCSLKFPLSVKVFAQ